jgi:hypothetical protein
MMVELFGISLLDLTPATVRLQLQHWTYRHAEFGLPMRSTQRVPLHMVPK